MARPRRRGQGRGRRPQGPRPVPDARGGAGVLRRLRRNWPVRRRDRRIGVRHLTGPDRRTPAISPPFNEPDRTNAMTDLALTNDTPASPDDFSNEDLGELSLEFERLPATKIIQWAVDNFAP